MRFRFIYGLVLVTGMGFLAVGVMASSDPRPEAKPFTDQACLDCHTDQAKLQELAVVVEEVEAPPSEGPG
jgi:hypothetical protein